MSIYYKINIYVKETNHHFYLLGHTVDSIARRYNARPKEYLLYNVQVEDWARAIEEWKADAIRPCDFISTYLERLIPKNSIILCNSTLIPSY